MKDTSIEFFIGSGNIVYLDLKVVSKWKKQFYF